MSVYLVELFYSIQGEGAFAGFPSVFVRLGGCNLQCPGFPCDTPYAIDAAKYKKSQKFDDLRKFADEILVFLNGTKAQLVIFTGGEPTLFMNNREFADIVSQLQKQGLTVCVETNGTIKPDFESFKEYKNISFALSVKLSNSGEPYEKRVKPDVVKAIADNTEKSFFKFVLDTQTIQATAQELKKICEISPALDVWCMPNGATRTQLAKNAACVAAFCLENGYRYSDRLHIRIWGKKRGV